MTTLEDYENSKCPFCGKVGECKHLFGLFDLLENSVTAGYLVDKEEPFLTIVRDYYLDIIIRYGYRKNIFVNKFDTGFSIWEELLCERESWRINNSDFLSDYKLYFPDHLVIRNFLFLSDCEVIEAHEPYGPFLGWSLNFYTKTNMKKEYDRIMELIVPDLNLDFNEKIKPLKRPKNLPR